MVIELALSSCEDSGIHTYSDRELSDSEYADDIVLPSENPSKLQVFLDSLTVV